MNLGVKGRQAVLCGSSKGLGFACAQALVNEGIHVVLNGRDKNRLQDAVKSSARIMI